MFIAVITETTNNHSSRYVMDRLFSFKEEIQEELDSAIASATRQHIHRRGDRYLYDAETGETTEVRADYIYCCPDLTTREAFTQLYRVADTRRTTLEGRAGILTDAKCILLEPTTETGRIELRSCYRDHADIVDYTDSPHNLLGWFSDRQEY